MLRIAITILMSVLIAANPASAQSTPVGCVWYKTTNTTVGGTSFNQQDVCQNGVCRWYEIPNCGNCEVQLCFDAAYVECEQVGCVVVTSTGGATACFIPCSQPGNPAMSATVHLRSRAIGTRGAYECASANCANCPSQNMDYIDQYIDDWNNGNWVTTGSRTLHCDCWSSPPCCN